MENVEYIKDKKKNETENSPTDENNGAPATNTKTTNTAYPLRKAPSVKSELVKELQQLLNERLADLKPPTVPYYNNSPLIRLAEDGYYGDRTAAVIAWFFPDSDGSTLTGQMFEELNKRQDNFYLFDTK